MLQIVSSPSGSLQYRSAHVYHTIEDRSLVPAPTISSNTGTLYTPIYTDKGPTGKVMHFSGMTAYADLISTFGNPNSFNPYSPGFSIYLYHQDQFHRHYHSFLR